MKRTILLLLMIWAAFGQLPETTREGDLKLPNGKSQKEEILKEDYKRNLEDSAATGEAGR